MCQVCHVFRVSRCVRCTAITTVPWIFLHASRICLLTDIMRLDITPVEIHFFHSSTTGAIGHLLHRARSVQQKSPLGLGGIILHIRQSSLLHCPPSSSATMTDILQRNDERDGRTVRPMFHLLIFFNTSSSDGRAV